MDELVIGDKTYISSKRAAAITGYAKDYIGQLCREGRVEAKLVGRSWYVYEPSLKKHRFKEEGAAIEEVTPVENKEEAPAEISGLSEISNEQAILEDSPKYQAEETPILPNISTEKDSQEVPESEREQEVEEVDIPMERTSEVQTAWEEWFQKDPARSPKTSIEEPRTDETPVMMHKERIEQPTKRPVFHDIRPAAPEVLIEEARTSAAVLKSVRPQRTKRKGNLVISAVLIAIMLISVSFAVVASGGADRMAERSVLGEFLMVLGGTSIVE